MGLRWIRAPFTIVTNGLDVLDSDQECGCAECCPEIVRERFG